MKVHAAVWILVLAALAQDTFAQSRVEFVCENNREYVDDKGVVHLRIKDK